jgi:ABC-type enterobactin transport system permease subunit
MRRFCGSSEHPGLCSRHWSAGCSPWPAPHTRGCFGIRLPTPICWVLLPALGLARRSRFPTRRRAIASGYRSPLLLEPSQASRAPMCSAVQRGGVRNTGTLVLAGVTVAAFMTAAQTFVQQQQSETLREVYAWLLGGFSDATWQQIILVAPYIAISVGIILLHRRVLEVLKLGDEEAASLGLNVRRVPHTVRMLASTSYRAVVPLSLLVGAGFLVIADVIARTVLAPSELPIGVVTAFFGAPFFAVVLRTMGRVST